ncbi:ArsR family transcriptional regulator [Sphingomonas kaistensis]|uniref:ArsR family transcriptional regulator n=1 Tax=Sphingomonas kaistensis TaxID=298708 RepID=A0A7X5Y404_9SPHN|nr:metalloregulator ArsR/SmtB family transcription factor [Sphingomonas kaistensis]NJC04308.1 ArsR family transcriptional regulator [Sphingomonas kaistensis]
MTIPLPLADLFQALADPSRLRLLALLKEMELTVGELAQVLAQSQPRVSRHLKILADARLVERRKEGSWVFLQLGEPALVDALTGLWEVAADAVTTRQFAADRARLAAVRADRAEAAARYFAAHAAEWDQIRSLHVADAQVEEAIREALGDGAIGQLVDIGTGTGRMIELFGAAATRSIGIDRSTEMLRLARVKLEQAGVEAVSLRQGDMYALPLPDAEADVVLLHQVLHYAHSPAAAVAEGARLLRAGGRLLIIDFAPHEREELRDSAQHARLGFSDEAVLGWLAAAGLDGKVVRHLKGGELTVTLWAGVRTPRLDQERKAA